MDAKRRRTNPPWKPLLQAALPQSRPGFPSPAIEQLLPALRAETEPMAKALGFLQVHQHLMLASDAVLDDLRFARAVFAANGRQHEEIRAVFMQAQVLRTLGYAQQAHSVVRHALKTLPLSLGERAALAYQGVHALTQLFRYDEADSLAEHHICPVLTGNKGVSPRFIWWVSLGYLRTQQFARASGHPSVMTLDLPPGAPVDRELARQRLDQARQCLESARALVDSELDVHILGSLEVTVVGSGGDMARAQRLYARQAHQLAGAAPQLWVGLNLNHGLVLHANGAPERAYRVLRRAADAARVHSLEGPLHMASYSLARLARELERPRVALQHYEEFIRLHTRQMRQLENWFTRAEDLSLYGHRPERVRIEEANLHIAKPPYLRRALAALDAAAAAPPSIKSLAGSVGVSPRTLEKAMQRYQGVTPKAYIRERRMRLALDRLTATDAPVSMISAELGYASVSSFSRDFRQVFGHPPSEARHQRTRQA